MYISMSDNNSSTSVQVVKNVFETDDITNILNNDVVQQKRQLLKNTNKIRFSLEVNDIIKNKLTNAFNLPSMNNMSEIPMTWIKGNTPEHKDVSIDESFKNTYLLYLTDSYGNFVINEDKYDMLSNTGYIFNEGLSHKTIDIEDDSERLLVGPINEYCTPVGINPYVINPNTGSSNGGNIITITNEYEPFTDRVPTSYTVTYTSGNNAITSSAITLIDPNNIQITMEPISYWDDAQIGVNYFYLTFPNGDFIFIREYIYTEPFICFKEDTKILTDKGYTPIQELKKGDLVKTLHNNYLPIDMIGKREMYHPCSNERIKDQLYTCSKNQYPELFEDLVITGLHSILVDKFKPDEKEKTTALLGKKIITDHKYCLPVCVDERASVYAIPGNYTIYHLVLTSKNENTNYGIYANGLLTESCSKKVFNTYYV
jgi:hypothetical protein